MFQVREVSANGPNIPPEPSPQETQKTFVREMKHPILRPGYVPIPVFHEGAELRQQQHPCYSYIQPSTAQTIRTDGRTPSPTPALHCRPRSPLHGPSESCSTDPGKVGSPVSQTAEVGLGFSTSLQAGYIPIPVIHEGGGGQTQTQAQLNPSVYSQRVPYSEHQQPFHRIQTDEWPGYSAAMQPPRERASPILITQHRDPATIHLPPHIRTDIQKPQQPQHFQQPPPQQPQQFQQPQHFQQPLHFHQAPPQMSPQPQQPEQLMQSPQQFQPPQKPEQPQQHTDVTAVPPEVPSVKVEAEQAAQCPVHPGLAKVQKIVERVSKLEQEVKCFDGKKNDKKYLLLEELLTKELLALDSVDPEGRVDVRQARRDGVRRVQTILEELEQLEEQPAKLAGDTAMEGDNLTQKGEPSMITKENVEMSAPANSPLPLSTAFVEVACID
uniref:BCL2 associated athanogene 3 n=1 Tax=Seriola lalandi dorsalis TaxID=1841481 RepID=A0A3B4W9E0_SERLL